MPIVIDDEWLAKIMENKPVAIDDKAIVYREAGISEKEIDMLISNHKISSLLDAVVVSGCDAKDTAAWILTDCAGILRKDGKTLNELAIAPEKLSSIIKMVNQGDINRSAGKKILIAVIKEDADPVAYCRENDLDKKFDASVIDGVVDRVINSNAQAVQDYKNGKVKALQALFGACMRELKGAGDPVVIKALLEQKLK